MPASVSVVVEHAWHRVPGGTATAVDATLEALVEAGGFELSGIAAAHRRKADTVIAARTHWLPRPVLYECWHRLGWPHSGAGADVIWAPAMAVPPRTKPMVVTVHDLDFLEHPERLSRRGASFFPRAWQAALDRADVLAVPSHTVGQAVVRHGADPTRVEVVPWGVTVEAAERPRMQAMEARLGFVGPFVLWVGTAEPRKNLDSLVKAMAPLEVPLVVAGPAGWGVDVDAILAPLGDRVVRLGRLDRADLNAVYALATVFAFPSFDEGFGLPVLEAMAQGTAVVTSSGTATEEAAGGAACLVDPHDVASIRAGLRSVLDDPDERARLEAVGEERASNATWTRSAEGYRRIFDRLASGQTAERP